MMEDTAAVPGGGEAMPGEAGSPSAAAGPRSAGSGPGYQAGQADPGYQVADTSRLCAKILSELEQVIVGKREAVGLVLLGILASGHILIEDLPGLGKTLLARSFARVLGLEFTRVQFTPDMLPADLTGAAVLDPGTGEVAFRRGPVFTNLLLADEINRTPPKTQAALLEAMAEAQVSADGHTYPLAQPFVVLATDNPIEYEGTYPLPEAQLDRFIARVRLGYLDHAGEAEMARRRLARGSAPPQPGQVTDAAGLLTMRESLERVHLDADLLDYIVSLIAATRTHPKASVGASPRGTLAVIQLARGSAVLESRDYVTPEDVKAVAVPALAHRLVLRPEMWVRQVTGEDVIGEILEAVPVPRAG
jgi:MoxR-like ATPase